MSSNILKSKVLFLGDHCEVVTIFRDKTANAPVDVEMPRMVITDSNNNIVNLRYLVHLSPTSAKKGEYYSTFLTEGLTEGIYNIKAEGYYPSSDEQNNLLSNEDKFEIMNIDNVQSHINILREQLHDHLPQLYLIDDDEKFRWNDGELYNCLKRAVSAWNETPPVSSGNDVYTIDNFPHLDIMLWGAEFYALNQKGLLEIFNTIQYNDDISFTIDRFPKIQQKMQLLLQTWQTRIKEMKKDSVWRSGTPLGIRSQRLPGRVLRNLSFLPQFSFLASGGY